MGQVVFCVVVLGVTALQKLFEYLKIKKTEQRIIIIILIIVNFFILYICFSGYNAGVKKTAFSGIENGVIEKLREKIKDFFGRKKSKEKRVA